METATAAVLQRSGTSEQVYTQFTLEMESGDSGDVLVYTALFFDTLVVGNYDLKLWRNSASLAVIPGAMDVTRARERQPAHLYGRVQLVVGATGLNVPPTISVEDGRSCGLGCYPFSVTPGVMQELSYYTGVARPFSNVLRVVDLPPNCSVAGGDSRTFTVMPGTVVEVRFDVTCTAG
jgi:hypothetical protein